MDSSVVDLCLSAFDWAKFRRTKGAIKIHLQLDHDGYLPEYAYISEGKVHDKKALTHFTFKPGAIYVFDRGYNDYGFYAHLTEIEAIFVARLKNNAKYEVIERLPASSKRLILINFFRAEADRRQQEEGLPNIVYAIEEPETSQHPGHQRSLIDALIALSETENAQVFLTTHSSEIVKKLKFENILLIAGQDPGEIYQV
jgi:hypothetical protein